MGWPGRDFLERESELFWWISWVVCESLAYDSKIKLLLLIV